MYVQKIRENSCRFENFPRFLREIKKAGNVPLYVQCPLPDDASALFSYQSLDNTILIAISCVS